MKTTLPKAILTLILTTTLQTAIAWSQETPIEFEFDSPATFADPSGVTTTLEPGLYGVSITRKMHMTLVDANGDTNTIATLIGSHELDLETPEGLATIDEDGIHLVVLFPGSLSIEATGTPGNVTTRGRVRKNATLLSFNAKRLLLARPQRTNRVHVIAQVAPIYAYAPTIPTYSVAAQPDLSGSFDSATRIVTITNSGTADAVFTNGGYLMSSHTVPPGGKIVVGQQVELSPSFSNVVCPSLPTSATYEFLPAWIDSQDVIAESNENNNKVPVVGVPFPAQLTAAQAAAWETNPGDVAVRMETRPTLSGGRHAIEIDVFWKNVGNNYAYSCSNGSLSISLRYPSPNGGMVNAGISQNLLRMVPGEESTLTRTFIYAEESQYGLIHFFEPGCYSIEAEFDPRNVVRESNENNNLVVKKIPLNGGSCP